LSTFAQKSEEYYLEGFKYQSKLKLEKATDAYCKAIKASENKSNISSKELYYLTYAHIEIAKIYSGVSIFSNKSDNILTAYNSIKKVFEYYAILYQRKEETFINDFERTKILTIAKESLKNIYTINPDLFPSRNKINNDTNTTLGIELEWKNDHLAIVKKYTALNKSIEENYLKNNDVILEITTANDYKYYSLLDFIITNRIAGEGINGDTFKMKIVRNGQVEYTQVKKYLKQTKIEPISTKENRSANNEEDKIVTLTVSGTGKTKEDAQKNALRNAIEQAFGAFISAKTEILNDSVIKDEIVSIASGNIQSFEVLSEGELPNGLVVSTLKTNISITKLTTFAESKGAEVEFKGAIFAMDMKLQKLNEKNEVIALKNLLEISDKILSKSLDFRLEVQDPILYNEEKSLYKIEIPIYVKSNANFKIFLTNFWKTVKAISMSPQELEYYQKVNKGYFQIVEAYDAFNQQGPKQALKEGPTYYLRNRSSLVLLCMFLKNANRHLFNIIIAGESKPVYLSNFFPAGFTQEQIEVGASINNLRPSVNTGLTHNECSNFAPCDGILNWVENRGFVSSYPNSVLSRRMRQHHGDVIKYSGFYNEFISDIAKEPDSHYYHNYNVPKASENVLIENYTDYRILMAISSEFCEYRFILTRILSIDEIQKISQYKILQP
jgi:hypothetical protein